MAITERDAAYYASMQRTFETTGWENLRKGWQAEVDSLPEAMFFNAKSMEDMVKARVRYGLLRELLDLPVSLETQYNALVDGDAERE